MPKPEIRIAGPSDTNAWSELRHRLWPESPVARHRLEIQQILRSQGVVALAVADGAVVGFIEVSIRADHVEGTSISPIPYVEGWYVVATNRGRGVGTALLSFVEGWARDHWYSEIASDAEMANESAIRRHGNAGFREVGRSVHFVKGL